MGGQHVGAEVHTMVGGSTQMVSMGVRWHGHGTGADLGWPVEMDARTCLGWQQRIEKGWGVSKRVGTH